MPFSDEIARFYDAHPYPPPVEDLDSSIARGGDQGARRIEHFRHWPTLRYREDHSILIAGCGSSQAARWAARYPRSAVVGIDVSPASLEAEQRLSDKHQLDNLTLTELPIEEVGSLGTVFDQIVCTGVLHHLLDPAAGLRALRDVLADQGAMQLMVYGTYGRTGISVLREYCRLLGIDPNAEEIDQLSQVLKELPSGHPMSHALRESADFRDRDALADALLNPRERSYTVTELFDLLDDNDVRFGRWVRQAPYRPQCGIMRELAHGPRIAGMPERDQFAAMELFRGTMSRHSLIAHREDSSLPVAPLDWGDQRSAGYVPMVPRTVVVVEDGVPSRAAAAVINQAHVDRDLVCLLSSEELETFRAVDNVTPIRELGRIAPGLIERLWLHDLVIIDASSG